MELAVISHFFNEEFLLPMWLKYHTKIFDYGVMIDYDSTDDSVDIIRELAPTWDIRRSNNRDFSAEAVDLEVMHIEKQLGYRWKIALNVTEFILHPDLRGLCNEFLYTHPNDNGFRLTGVNMVENPQTYNTLDDSPLVFQKTFGHLSPSGPRNRIMHHAHDGAYLIGRHQTLWENIVVHPNIAFCLWFGFSPYPQVKERKLQIQTRIPESDRKLALGAEHITTSEELDARWEAGVTISNDLLEIPEYRIVWEQTKEALYKL